MINFHYSFLKVKIMKRKQTPSRRKPRLGSICAGSFRNQDLIPEFWQTLYEYAPRIAKRIAKENGYTENVTDDYYETETADGLRLSLYDALNEVAERVPFAYFGSCEGNDSDFGFWVCSLDFAEEVLHCSNDMRSPNRKELSGYSYYATVTDHGNVTLFYKNHREVWSVV